MIFRGTLVGKQWSRPGLISLARGIHCCPNSFISFARPASLCCEKYVYIYMNVSDRVEILCGLSLLPNNAANTIFLHRSGAVRNGDWIYIYHWGAGLAVTGRICDTVQNVFTIFSSNRN
jgi:hypothetical protein